MTEAGTFATSLRLCPAEYKATAAGFQQLGYIVQKYSTDGFEQQLEGYNLQMKKSAIIYKGRCYNLTPQNCYSHPQQYICV